MLDHLGNAPDDDSGGRSRTGRHQEATAIPAQRHPGRTWCLDSLRGSRVQQPHQQRDPDRRTEQRRQCRGRRLFRSMPGSHGAEQAEQADANDAGDLATDSEETDDQRRDCQHHDDASAQRQLVVGAEPSDGQLLQPRRHPVDELATDRIDRRDDVDDPGDEHARRDRDRAGDEACGRAVQTRRRVASGRLDG